MPTTKKESLQFGLMMCFGMVLVMTMYNFYLNGMFGEMTFIEGIVDLITGFIVAFILDWFIVGPIAKKVALKLTANTNNKLYTVLAISTCMVIGMAFFMSIYGFIMSNLNSGFDYNSIVTDYLSVFGRNFILALPLQIIIMGPVVRYLFTKYIKSNKNEFRNLEEI
ncbi:DUF2798 domain-containing protein [Heyndrickxia vini]|uniref:DUF2798 domain-containing protein n=1 Tax=Heyndrickxia vini TaxID=1476025 RepID=A0ABX7E6L1_9BACI|nr:DUF2798 domain-containing protein [Heyndrickxia vini]QQZ11394.1 DUF2798 domain-containing protein [Heyndrickxia vini]